MAGELEHFPMVIGGKAVDAESGATFESQNPYTGRPWAVVPDGGPDDVDAAVAAARAALDGEWGAMTGFARAALMRRLADLIAENAERLARLEVNDSGKLYREMIGQINGLGGWYQYFAGLADKLEGRQIPSPNPNYLVYTRREPVGVVAAITPWNSPLLLMTWKLAPALAAGCTVVIKPSEHAPVSTLGFAGCSSEAGFPPGVVNVVTGLSPRDSGRRSPAHPGVDKVAFTGSTATGRAVAHAAAENLNKVTLELGGKSPQVVFPDADLAAAANGVLAGVFAATGQTCMAGSRLIVHADVHDELVRLVAERAARIKLGRPERPGHRDGADREPRRSTRRCCGYLRHGQRRGGDGRMRRGRRRGLGGLFVKPTVLTGITPESTVVREEVFGPVLAALTVHRRGRGRQARQRHALRPGRGGVDQGRAPRPPGGRPDPGGHRVDQRLPRRRPARAVRRVRASGLGRENGIHAIDEYLEEKAIWVELTGGTRDPFTLG